MQTSSHTMLKIKVYACFPCYIGEIFDLLFRLPFVSIYSQNTRIQTKIGFFVKLEYNRSIKIQTSLSSSGFSQMPTIPTIEISF